MDEQIALPRKNGELIFEAPWEARAFGLAVALNEDGAYPWSDFSQTLSQQIAAAQQNKSAESDDEPSTYYESWLAALEELLITNGLVTSHEIERIVQKQALHDTHHEHSHEHGHEHEHW
ncbi:nitrile hydratase accessory protein [Chloroflexi bacterium TSY]|nr:nitrile hydratase accessory protein [Chloroflexi bacterium TSY]